MLRRVLLTAFALNAFESTVLSLFGIHPAIRVGSTLFRTVGLPLTALWLLLLISYPVSRIDDGWDAEARERRAAARAARA